MSPWLLSVDIYMLLIIRHTKSLHDQSRKQREGAETARELQPQRKGLKACSLKTQTLQTLQIQAI